MKSNSRKFKVLAGLIIIILFLQACNIPFLQKDINPDEPNATEETSEVFIPLVEAEDETEAPEIEEESESEATAESPTAEPVVHIVTPSEPGWVSKYFYDTDSSTTAASKSAAGGDDYYDNKYERPFSQTDMVYYPDLDILKAEIAHDDNFYYISITVKGLNPTTNSLTGTYGAELDTDLDGRGDYLFYCDVPNFTEWKIDTVHAFKDGNNDVGGVTPTYPEAPTSGDGYETMIFSPSLVDDPDGLWCRQRQGTDTKVDLAIHKTLIGSPGQFAWGVWTDLGLKQPGWFDYNDHFTFDQAGSPMAGNSYYPLKEIHSLDSTCRESFGFEPVEDIPGLCFVPTPTPTNPPAPTNTPQPGILTGAIFLDYNKDGNMNGSDYYVVRTKTFRLKTGACGVAGTIVRTTTAAAYYWGGLIAGTYCLSLTDMGYVYTPLPKTVTVISGATVREDVGINDLIY